MKMRFHPLIAVFFSAFPGVSCFAAEQARTLTTLPSSPAYLIKLVLGLVAVLLLFSAIAWLVRRFGLGGFSNHSNGELKLMESLSLGSRERLVIVQAGEQRLLLGITPGQINQLHVMGPASAAENNFKTQLAKQKKQT